MDANLETQSETAEQKTSEAQAGQENLSDEAKLAQEALALTDEPDKDSDAGLTREKTSLVNEVTALRAIRRELGQEIQSLRDRAEQARPPEKSPLEKYTEENPNDPVPASVMLAERDFQNKQSELRSQQTKASTVSSRLESQISKANERFTLFDEVIAGAQDLITEGDRLDFKNAIEDPNKDAAEEMYKRCVFRTLMAGGNRAKVLREKLRQIANPNASAQKTNENKGGSTEIKVPEKAPESIEEVTSNPMKAHIYSVLGMEP